MRPSYTYVFRAAILAGDRHYPPNGSRREAEESHRRCNNGFGVVCLREKVFSFFFFAI